MTLPGVTERRGFSEARRRTGSYDDLLLWHEHAVRAYVAGQVLEHAGHDVMRLEGLTVVLADVAIGGKSGLAAQVAGELAGEVVLRR